MTASILVRQLGEDQFQWLPAAASNDAVETGSLAELKEAAAQDSGVSLMLMTEDCQLRQMSFEPGEAKLLRQTLPYELEEELLSDVDELHFALGTAEQLQVPVALIAEQRMVDWQREFAAAGLNWQQAIPELLLLPWLPEQWTLVLDGERWLLRHDRFAGFCFDAATAKLALSLLLEEQGAPASVFIYCDESQREQVISELPPPLQSLAVWQQGSYWPLLSGNLDSREPLDMLQGEFARSLPWRRWWREWKLAACLLLAVLSLQLILGLIEFNQLENRNLALRQDIEKAYRSAVPKGAVMDAERQLKRKLAGLRGGGGASFIALLDKVGSESAKVPGFVIQGMNYSEKQTELRLTVLANSFADIETVRAALKGRGLDAELTGSNSDGDKTRARLRVKGG